MAINSIRKIRCTVAISAMMIGMAIGASASDAQAANPSSQQVTKCLNTVDRTAGAPPQSSFPAAVIRAAKSSCVISGDAKQATTYLAQYQLPGMDKRMSDLKKITMSNYSKSTSEPGLLGLNGAEELLRDMLVKEATYVWAEANKRGGIPGLTPPPASSGNSSGLKILHAGAQPVVTVATATPLDYAQAYIDLLKRDRDAGQLLKARMFLKLKEIALARRKLTPDELRFKNVMENYINKQTIHLAQVALDKFYVWERETKAKLARDPRNRGLGSLMYTGETPPDFAAEAKAALALGAGGAAMTSVIGSIMGASTAQFTFISSFATTNAVTLGSSSAASIAGAAAGPAAIIVTAVIIGALKLDQVISANGKEGELKKALRVATATRADLAQMFNFRNTVQMVRHFYAKATSGSSPAGYVAPASGCRVCLYDQANFLGEPVCTAGRISNLGSANTGSTAVKFNNKATSLRLETDNCPGAHAILHENDRFGTEQIIVQGSVADLSKLPRGRSGSWNNVASSIQFSNKAAPQCEACLYNEPNFKGAFYCVNGANPNLHIIDFGDKAESVEMNTKDCPDAKVWLYHKKNLVRNSAGGGVRSFSTSKADLGQSWKNNVSSVMFAPTGLNNLEERASGGCRVCVYEHTNFRGDYACTNAEIPKLGKLEFELNDDVSSVQMLLDSCPNGQKFAAQLYTGENYKGKSFTTGKSVSNVGKEWNDVVSSIRFKNVTAQIKAATTQVAAVQAAAQTITSGPAVPIPLVQIKGFANDVAVSTAGRAWVIGRSPERGGYGIYARKGNGWNKVSGSAVRVTVAGEIPWLVAKNGSVYRWHNGRWVKDPTAPKAQDIGASDVAVWLVGNDGSIHALVGGKWRRVSGKGTRIAAQMTTPWLVNAQGNIYFLDGQKWKQIPGPSAVDIGASQGGVWIVGKDGAAYQYVKGKWVKTNIGNVRHIAVTAQGMPWVVNDKNQIYTTPNSTMNWR